MKKRLFAMIICIFTVFASITGMAFSDVGKESPYAQAIDNLVSLGIISGYGDGSFGAKDYLTRAQFAKIVVSSIGNGESAITRTTENFSDVKSNHWAIGYINEAADSGIITGYPNGKFCPDENITYGQVITVLIRVLGYSPDEVGTNWPTDYVNKAREIGIIEGLNVNSASPVTREVAAYMLYKSFGAKSGGSSTINTAKRVDDVIIYGVNSTNSGIKIDEVVTSNGTFKRGKADVDSYLGKKVSIRVNSRNEIDMVIPVEQNVSSYTVSAAYSDKMLSTNGNYIDIDGNMETYYRGSKGMYSSIYSQITAGSKMEVYDDYIYVSENKLEGPYTVKSNYNDIYNYFGDVKNAVVTIDGESAKLTDIERYDVVYYNSVTNRIHAYSKRVTGVYEKAIPSKDNLNSITVSGEAYENIGASALEKLDDSEGSFDINDRITLLFGNDGSIVDVVDEAGVTLDDMGVLLKSFSKISNESDTTGKKEFFVTLMLASGKEVTYKTSKDYSDTEGRKYSGEFVYINVTKDGTVTLELADKNSESGYFDKSVPSYGGHDFMQNYSILECVYSEKYEEAIVKKINLSDITASYLKENQVIHVEYANAMKDIAVLYVKDVSNSGYEYGILTKATKDEESNYRYEFMSSSGISSYSGSAGWSFSKGEMVMVLSKGNEIKSIKGMMKIDTGSKIQEYNGYKIMMNDKSYRVDENASVIYKTVGNEGWNVTTIKDMRENVKSGIWDISQITFYSDKTENVTIRAIRVTLKS